MALTEAPRVGVADGGDGEPLGGGDVLFADRGTAPAPAPAPHAERRRRRSTDRSGGSGGGHLPYFPALDGIRGLAVISVLFFHAGFSWAVGGYLGVSTFFTLSGFLITSLLLAERNATGDIGLRGFWVRRFRRLLPAALAAIALGVLVAILIDPVQRRNIGGDVVSSLGYVANWRFVLSGKSYAELFSTPSPLQHFWSLAIEEQFYLLYPLLVFGILRLTRGSRQLFAIVLAGLTAVSVALPLILGYSNDRIYYGTDARAAELLMGGLLATALYHRPITDRLATSRRAQVVTATLGGLALVGCVVMWATIDQQSAPLYKGGFFVYSILSVLVILAALLPIGPVATGLAIRPLRFMGKISYGVYLYHWPIFLALDEQRTHLTGIPLFAVQVSLTLAVSCASYRFLEMPIRKGQPLFGGTSLPMRPVRLAPFAISLLAVAAVIVGLTSPPPAIDFERAQAGLQFSDAPPPVFDPTSVTPPRPRVATFGDSTALETAFGLNAWLRQSDKGDMVEGYTQLGCSIIRGGSRKDTFGEGKNDPGCDSWDTTFKDKVAKGQPNIALVQDGPWEVVDHHLPEDAFRVFRSAGDPVFDRHLATEMTGVIDTLSAGGAEVFWLTLPPIRGKTGPEGTPARQQAYNNIVRALPYLRPGKVQVLDLDGWIAANGDDKRLRPDGVHFSSEPDGGTSKEVAQRWLGDTMIKAFDDDWVAKRKADFDKQHGGTAASDATSSPSTAPAPAPAGGSASQPATPAAWKGQLGGLRPPRVEVVGDSAALGFAIGMGAWAKGGQGDGTMETASLASIGCGLGRGGSRKNHDKVEVVPKDCQTWAADVPRVLARDRPDLLLVMDGLWEATDRQLAGDTTWRAPGDPVYDDYLRKELGAVADVLHSRGAPVVWMTFPRVDLGADEPNHSQHPYPVNDPARMQRVNDIVREVATSRPWMHVLDLAAYAETFPRGPLDPDYRLDGVHFTVPAATRVMQDWLAMQLFQIYRDAHDTPAPSTTAPPAATPATPNTVTA